MIMRLSSSIITLLSCQHECAKTAEFRRFTLPSHHTKFCHDTEVRMNATVLKNVLNLQQWRQQDLIHRKETLFLHPW